MTGPPAVEPVTSSPLRRIDRPVLRQRWRSVAFLHWPVRPQDVAPLLPAGTVPDVLDGRTWVGLVPFLTAASGPARGPYVPWLGRFCEVNVRLYTVDVRGRRGIYFCSLDAGRLLPALGARWGLGLNYLWSRAVTTGPGDTTGGLVTYRSRRRFPGPRGAGGRVQLAVEQPLPEPTAMELFVTARWGLHVRHAGRTWYLPAEHQPWPLHRARALVVEEDLLATAGARPYGGLESVLWSPGVDTVFGRPLRVPPE